ncbi:helix-turn-helix domain-containing protein [Methanomassiliicoccus luminyensis]|uniref:helix-turn-helix domain-containing protein n=1 Tax=Methanomassiliicoccus luminyensis TaxID=1080712 RepID=UPI0003686667|nr:XRE family transcriptional regulator [Methanomassiliicoccus luminyensis]
MSSSQLLGTRIRTYRERLGLSVEDLAKNAGLDAALVSNVEDGAVYPSISVLVKLSRALGQRVGTFMDDQFVDGPVIVRAGERKDDGTPHRGAGPANYRYYPLGQGKTDRHMEPFYIDIEPNGEESLSSHEGEEFIIVVSGEVEVQVGKEASRLKAGDSIYYNSIVPHLVKAAGAERAAIYAVVYTPF